MKKLYLSLVAVVAMCVLSASAHATITIVQGYPCRVHQYNYAGLGTYGGILVTYYTGPRCTGSYQYSGYACTVGATSSVCPTNGYLSYSELQLETLFNSFVEAAHNARQVEYYQNTSCKAGGTSCMDSIYFLGS